MLTIKEIEASKATGKDYQRADGGGLSLLIRAKGKKVWRYEYLVTGKKERLDIGSYPALSLSEVRSLHRNLKLEFERTGITPKQQLEIQIAAKAPVTETRQTFSSVLEQYRNEWLPIHWKSPEKRWGFLNMHLNPILGDKPIETITKADIRDLLTLKRLTSGEATAIGLLRALRHIYIWSIEQDICENNPAAAIQAKGVGKLVKRDRYMTPPEIKKYLTLIYQSSSYRGYKLGLHLLLMLGLRLNELCGSNWCEFSDDGTEWTIPKERMKGKREHSIILPRQAIEIFKELRYLGSGSEWVFPMLTNSKRCMNGNNLGEPHRSACAAGDIADYVMHDHRHTVSTFLNGLGKFPSEAIEAVLAHKIRGMAGVYNNNDYKNLRADIVQYWADTLDNIASEATVIRANFKLAA
jgi:integrase